MTSGTQMGGGCQRMRANRKVVETNCLTCRGAFAFGEEVCVCAVCGAYHHAKCWDPSIGCHHDSTAAAPVAGKAPVAAQVGAAIATSGPGRAEAEVGGATARLEPIGGVSPRDVTCQRCGQRISPGGGYAVYPEAAEGAAADNRLFWATAAQGSFEQGDTEIRKLDIALYCEACAGAVFTRKVWDEAKPLRIEMDLKDTSTSDGVRARSEVLDFAIALPSKRRGVTPEQARKDAYELGQLWWKDQNAVRERLVGGNAAAVPGPQEPGKPKDCPKCRLVNPGSATRCDCGYDFVLGKMLPAPAAEIGSSLVSDVRSALVTRGALAADEQYCSQCREIIKLGALKCRFCGYVLDAQLKSQEMPSALMTQVNSQANTALWCGIIGVFICGPILGSMAISNGNKAIETMDMYPLFPGPRGKAQTGRVLGWLGWAFFVIYIIMQISKATR